MLQVFIVMFQEDFVPGPLIIAVVINMYEHRSEGFRRKQIQNIIKCVSLIGLLVIKL